MFGADLQRLTGTVGIQLCLLRFTITGRAFNTFLFIESFEMLMFEMCKTRSDPCCT